MPATCYDCPAPYHSWPDYRVDDAVWAQYGPTGHEGGLLCLNCFAQRLAVHARQRFDAGETGVVVEPIFAAAINGFALRPEERR